MSSLYFILVMAAVFEKNNNLDELEQYDALGS